MRRRPLFIVVAMCVANPNVPLAQSNNDADGDLSVIDQISLPEETSEMTGQTNPAGRADVITNQRPSVLQDTCPPANEKLRLLLDIVCTGDDASIPSDRIKVGHDPLMLQEDGAYFDVSPDLEGDDTER